MPHDVRLFLGRTFLFVLPFIVYGLLIVAIDPYQRFGTGGVTPSALKREIAFPMNYAMWKLIEFRRSPSPDILLGDSRMMNLPAAAVDSVSGRKWCNLAYGGGTLREAIDTFDFAHSRTRLQRVYIGLDLCTWNGSDLRDRVSEARGAIRNPMIYVLNNNVVRASFAIVKANATGYKPAIGVPEGTPEEFWRRQLDVTARVYLEGWSEPASYRRDLARIAEICRKEDIELTFVIFPTHTDLQELVPRYGLAEDNAQMRRDLAQLGTVYDFGWDNDLTRDRGSFTDPFHLTHAAAEVVIGSIWGRERSYVRVLDARDFAGK